MQLHFNNNKYKCITNISIIDHLGRGIPVVEHKEEKVLVPTLIFGHLLTSSNYNDDEKKVTGKLRFLLEKIEKS
jgi:DNA gyrase/topoisomerase IV subunit B